MNCNARIDKKLVLMLGPLLACNLLLSQRLGADEIIFTTEVTLSTSSGTDNLGFDGATFELRSIYDASGPYIERFGFPALVAQSSAVSITGSNFDGTYIPFNDIAYYPSYSGIYSDPAGFNDILIVVDDLRVSFGFQTATTRSGALKQPGDLPELSDFGPTSVLPVASSDSRILVDERTLYEFSSSSISAVPEPNSVVAFASSLALLLHRRRRAE